jgi:hypothetical protein
MHFLLRSIGYIGTKENIALLESLAEKSPYLKAATSPAPKQLQTTK